MGTYWAFNVDSVSTLIQNSALRLEGFPSGQRDQTVNLTAPPSEVRILPPPPENIAADDVGADYINGRF